jgi:hypothetical protein
LKEKHGHRPIATMPREAVFKLRDEFKETPRTANYIVSVLRLIFSFAEDRKHTFQTTNSVGKSGAATEEA